MSRPLHVAGRALLAAAITALIVPAAQAAPGDLDTGFGTAGVFTAPFMTTFPGAEDSQTLAVDSLGRVYLSATQEAQLNGGTPRQVNVVRLTAAGVPDATFGTAGTATLPTTGDLRNVGVVVDALDRPIILTNNGEVSGTQLIGLTRLTTGGQPDAGFDGDGVLATGLPGTALGLKTWPAGIALDKDGGILVVGTLVSGSTKQSGFVARFGAGGALDTTYGTGGWTAVGNAGTEMAAIHALPGGGAVAAGYDDFAEWVLGRLTGTGAPDATFDTDGEARSSLGKAGPDLISAYGVTVDLQSRPVVVGQLTSGGNATLAVARWTAAGAPDASFGTGTPAVGVKLLPAAAGARGIDAAAQCTDGKLLIAAFGSRPDLSGNRMDLSRLTDAGALDATFAAAALTPGVASMAAGTNNTTQDLVLTGAGAYVSGFRRQNDNMVFTDYPQVARFAANEACVTTPPPAGGGTTTPPVTTPVTTPSIPSKAALRVADLVAFPSTRKCVSRRRFQIRLRVPRSANVVRADVRVNGRSVAVRRGTRLRSTVDLRKLPKGKFSVKITLKLKSGKSISATRRYRTCAPKRRSR